ncbi:MAG: family 43 glycosylhydrolase [Christensenellaceae bacterium]
MFYASVTPIIFMQLLLRTDSIIVLFRSRALVGSEKGLYRGERSFGYTDFWAPEVIEHEGRYLMHYTARRRSDDTLADRRRCRRSAGGAFRRCHRRTHVQFRLRGDRRTRRPRRTENYLFYSRDCSQNVVEGRRESHIYAVRLDASLTRTLGEPVLLLKPDCPWELVTGDTRWNEGPFVVKRDGIYYLMYSSGFFASPTYSTGYAVSDKLLGPYKKSPDNPLLYSQGELSGPGHNSVVTSADGTDYCVFHVHTDPANPSQDRRMCFCPITFERVHPSALSAAF